MIDEFEGQIPQVDMKRILDSKPYDLEFKGGSRSALYTKVVIISNFHPFDWYRRTLQEPIIDRLFGRNGRVGHVFMYLTRGGGPERIDSAEAEIDVRVRRRVWAR